jgi:DNA-binding response OmpR family regulator
MKILLVEDSKFLRVATERALTTAGQEVISASETGFEAGPRAYA